MKTVRKYCVTLEEAEAYQDDLYDQYDFVTCSAWPFIGEEGWYAWEVGP